ncbi:MULTISPECIES: hypothetical protein [Paenibacillus]|uniref:Uncharacterized protein n=1 Tax=Paenibacillus bovis TaxID=1616788 RepID=A0A172ZL24_9BACL|nr:MULTISPECIES: hypothetical protein [Paenibacillus]ANF97957.1 hypothetical protein AR543_19320 [Paenibacillus bovis]
MNINLSVYQATPYNHQQFRPQAATMTADNTSVNTGGQSFQELLNAQMAATTSVTTYRRR